GERRLEIARLRGLCEGPEAGREKARATVGRVAVEVVAGRALHDEVDKGVAENVEREVAWILSERRLCLANLVVGDAAVPCGVGLGLGELEDDPVEPVMGAHTNVRQVHEDAVLAAGLGLADDWRGRLLLGRCRAPVVLLRRLGLPLPARARSRLGFRRPPGRA